MLDDILDDLMQLPDRELDGEVHRCLGKKVVRATNPETETEDYHWPKLGSLVVGADEQWRQLRVPDYSSSPSAAAKLDERIEDSGNEAKARYTQLFSALQRDDDVASARARALAFVQTCRDGLL